MIADSADIKFACPQCGQRMVVEKSGAGVTADCPFCHSPVTVPYVSSIYDHGSRGHRAESAAAPSESNTNFTDPSIDETREELFNATLAHGELQRELDVANKEVVRLQALFKKAVDECERVTASATHAQAEIKSFQGDRQQLKSDLSQAKQRMLAAEQQVAEFSASLAEAQQENQALRDQVESDLGVSREQLAATETQLLSRERELAALRDENSELVQSLAATQAELAALGRETAQVRGELECADKLLDEASQTEIEMRATNEELRGQLDGAANDIQCLTQERDRIREQVDVLQRDLKETDSGRGLLELRGQLESLSAEHRSIVSELAAKSAEVRNLSETGQALREELGTTIQQRDEAQRRAEANSEAQLKKDNDVLRGINQRDNVTIGVYHSELRRLRRARYALRIVYGVFGIALIGLVIFAISVFTRHGVGELFSELLR
jgi:chromosome segregation ATPase